MRNNQANRRDGVKTNRSKFGSVSRNRPSRPDGYTRSFMKLRDGMEAVRSSSDGMWRVWANIDAKIVDPNLFGRIWVVAGAGQKLSDAHRIAREAVRKAQPTSLEKSTPPTEIEQKEAA